MTEYIDRRTIGDITIAAIDEGAAIYRETVLDDAGQEVDAYGPDHPDGFWIGFHVFHIRTPDGSVLVDAGFDDPGSAWDVAFSKSFFVKRTAGVKQALEELGNPPETISALAITHAHFDHIAGLTVDIESGKELRYPKAQVYLGAQDIETFGSEEDSDIGQRLRTVQARGRLIGVGQRRELLPGVEMVHTGGESPGHCVIRVSSHGQVAYLLGDLFHYGFEVEHPDWMASWAERQTMREARDRIMADAADSDALVAFTHHGFSPWGHIRRDGSGYRWEIAPS